MSRYALETAVRAAAIDMLTDYASSASVKLQIYRARPRSVNPPCAFIEGLRETVTFDAMQERRVQVDITVLHGLFDSGEAVDQRDAFVDGFIDWATDNFHEAGTNTGIEPRSIEDEPNYIPDWLPPEQQRSYYATTLTLEGFAAGG